MHQFTDHQHAAQNPAPIRNRLLPVMHLETGDAVLLFAEAEKRFEERAVFGRVALAAERSETASPAEWIAERVEDVAQDAHYRTTERPVIIPIPMVALIHPDTAVACDAAVSRTHLCPQEICLEVEDAALALPSAQNAIEGIEALRRCGFRVSLNASRSWQAPLSYSLRVLLDSMRVDARKIEADEELQNRIDAAACSGMLVVAENAYWRDTEFLNSVGVEYGFRMKTDA
jgi:EAL domain-containing protein (putative c-di-GMP-specific phosphodiesterase class I)